MSNFTNDDVVKALGNLSVLEMIALTKELETKWGVKAEPGPVAFVPNTTVPNTVVQEEFDVVLKAVPADKKIQVIKVLREITGLGLKESKEMAESAPKVVKQGVSKMDAENFQSMLTQVGAEVEVK